MLCVFGAAVPTQGKHLEIMANVDAKGSENPSGDAGKIRGNPQTGEMKRSPSIANQRRAVVVKWIVDATLLHSTPETQNRSVSLRYTTDHEAMAKVREVAGEGYTIKVRTFDGMPDAIEMNHAEAMEWAKR